MGECEAVEEGDGAANSARLILCIKYSLAINDAYMPESGIYILLKKYFKEHQGALVTRRHDRVVPRSLVYETRP